MYRLRHPIASLLPYKHSLYTFSWQMGPGRCVQEDVSRQMCRGRCVMADVSRQMCPGRCVMADVSRQMCHGRCVQADVSWQMCHGRCVMADVSRQMYPGRCIQANVSRQMCPVFEPIEKILSWKSPWKSFRVLSHSNQIFSINISFLHLQTFCSIFMYHRYPQ